MKKLANTKVFKIFYIAFAIFCTEVLCLNYTPSSCICGRKNDVRFAVSGGEQADESEFPWHVAMFIGDKYRCGGSIINNLYILTAAHCFKDFLDENGILTDPTPNISIVLGGHKLNRLSRYKEEHSDIRNIKYVVIHENFTLPTHFNDISLIRLAEPITDYNEKISPICLPPVDQSFEDIKAIVCGWGALHADGSPVKILRKTDVMVLRNSECDQKLHFFAFEKDIMLCAASPGHDACVGDSGGALMIKLNLFQYAQVGVVSFGIQCGNYLTPGVYSRLNKFVQWIKNHTSDAIYCNKNFTLPYTNPEQEKFFKAVLGI